MRVLKRWNDLQFDPPVTFVNAIKITHIDELSLPVLSCNCDFGETCE